MQENPNALLERFDSPVYKRSRIVYCIECMWPYFFSLLMGDAYLAKLLTRLGLSDGLIGVVSSIGSLSLFAQLFTVFFNRNIKNSKTASTVCHGVGYLLQTFLFFMPFLPFKSNARRMAVMVILLTANIMINAIACTYFRWCNTFVSPLKRGSYGAVKEIVSQVGGILFTFGVGYTFDKLENSPDKDKCFLFIAILMLVITTLDVVSLLLIGREETEYGNTAKQKPIKSVFAETLGNKNFRAVVIQCALYAAAQNFICGFIGVFKTNSLGLSVLLIQIINIASYIVRIAISRLFGKIADRTSYAYGLRMGYIIAIISFIFVAFTTKKTWYLIIAFTVIYNVACAATEGNSGYICYSFLKADYFSEGLAIKNCAAGLTGFSAAVLGGIILNAVQKSGGFLGINILGQQLLAVISALITVAAIIFTNKKIIPLMQNKK